MNFKSLIGGRAVAIFVLAVVSGSSFTLGFFVGKTMKEDRAHISPLLEVKDEMTAVENTVDDPFITAEKQKTAVPEKEGFITIEKEEPKALAKEKLAPAKKEGPAALKKDKPLTSPTPYSVQVGAFKARQDAEALKDRLEKKGYKAIHIAFAKDSSVYKVRAGRFSERKDADIAALRLKKAEGLEAFVTSE